jgi:hypothetical protein
MARFQRGSLRVESRKNGATWVLRYFTTRQMDGRRVEHTLAVGLVRDFPSESAAWGEVACQHLNQQINQPGFRGRVTFADLAHHYMQNIAVASGSQNPESVFGAGSPESKLPKLANSDDHGHLAIGCSNEAIQVWTHRSHFANSIPEQRRVSHVHPVATTLGYLCPFNAH